MAHQIALKRNEVTGAYEEVCAADLNEKDRGTTFYCTGCRCPVFLHLSKVKANYFSSRDHHADCRVGLAHKDYVSNGDVMVCINEMLNHIDRPTARKAPGTGGASTGGLGAEKDDDDPDVIVVPRAKRIQTVKGLYILLKHERSDYVIDRDSGLTKRQLTLFDTQSVQEGLREGIVGLKLVRAKRCAPNASFLEPKIPHERGEIVLRDAYSDWEGAKGRQTIYFLVSGADEVSTKKINECVFDDKNKGKDILMLADWEKVTDEHYQIYRCKLNTRTFCLIDPL